MYIYIYINHSRVVKYDLTLYFETSCPTYKTRKDTNELG